MSEPEFHEWELVDDEDQTCKYCRGKGYLTVEPNSSLVYDCPDCTKAES